MDNKALKNKVIITAAVTGSMAKKREQSERTDDSAGDR